MFSCLRTKVLPAVLILLAAQCADAFGQATINGKSYLDTVCPDRAQEPCASAKKVMAAAEIIVTGEQSQGDDWTHMANKMLSSPEVGEAKFREGLKLVDAVNFYKSWLASPFTGDGNRLKVILLAYREVYGNAPLDIEKKVWLDRIKAGEAWYATIVSKEIANLNSAGVKRREMIARAYSRAFGRPANDGDLQYWLPRREHYQPLLDAQRRWLYSEQGAKDLRAAVRVALYPKLKREPTPEEIDKGVEKVRPERLIYAEMVAVLQK